MSTIRKWWLLAIAALVLLSPSIASADGMYSQNFTAVATSPTINNVGTAIAFHQLTWNVVGTASVCTVALDTSADGITWSAGGAITGQTCTSNGTSTVTNHIVNYVRINVTAITVTAGSRVNIVWNGYVNNPGGGGGGSLTATQVGFGSGGNTLTGATTLTYDSTNKFLSVLDGSPCSLTVISLLTVCDSTAAVTLAQQEIIGNSTATIAQTCWTMIGSAGNTGSSRGTYSCLGEETLGGGGLFFTQNSRASGGVSWQGSGGAVPGALEVGVAGISNNAAITEWFHTPDGGISGFLNNATGVADITLNSTLSTFKMPVTVSADGVHPGIISLVGNTTLPTLPANTASIIGSPAATQTSWSLQLPTAIPANGHLFTCTVSSTNCLLTDGGAVPTGTVTSIATTSPITGGTITATGTIACATCVTSAASLTSTNIMTGAGSQASQTPSSAATLDGSGNMAATSIKVGTSPPTCTIGTAGVLCENEGTAPTGASSVDALYADSTGHCLTILNQTANLGCALGELRATMTADWTCGTGGTVSSCTAAVIVGSTGVPMTITLPSAALSWDFDCDGVVGSATGDPANNWNLITATNAPTNTMASYSMGTAAAVGAFGATTGNSSTTTFNIGGTWTLGGTATKMPFHIHARIEGASASGTAVSLQLVDPTVGDLLTIYRGMSCWAHQ